MMFWATAFVVMSVVMAAASPVARLREGKTLPKLGGDFLTGRPVALLALGFTYAAHP
jgi:hypothetical protein